MRILLLQSSAYIPSMGGANKANRLLLEQLAAQGHECHVVGMAGGDGATAFRHAGVEVEAVQGGARLRAHAAARLRELAPDRVLVSSEDPAQVLLEEAVDASPHVVYLAHTTLHLPFGPDGFLQSPGRTALLARTAGIVAVSGYVRDYIRRQAGLESTLLRFPVYGDGPFPDIADAGRGFVTLINPCAVKGISIFLELARRLPEVAFAAVPTWGTTAGDREALASLPNVRILPPTAAIDEIFAQTRVLLAPSLWGEAFGQVAVEAMLRGIPVLASDAGGLPEAKLGVDYVLPVRPIRRYEERFDERKIPVAVVPAQDLGPWEETLRRLLADRELYARLSRESRQAAHDFVAGLGIEPFQDFLAGLPARPDASRRPIKILLVQPLTYLFAPGGAHKANRLLLQGLAARGHACRVVAPRDAGEAVFLYEGVEVHTAAGGLELCAEAARQIRLFEPDWTIVSEDPSGEILQEVLEASPSRVVYLAHSPATLPFGPASFSPDEAKTALLRRTAGILTVSRAMRDYVLRWAGLDSTVVYSPAYGSGPFPALGAFDRGFVAMINPSGIKGVSIFAGLARRMPGVAFAAVPTWSTTGEDRELLAGLPNVTLLPASDDLDELFARVRVLLVPSLWGEAFGQVVVEALLRGIPVVTSDQGGLPEAGLGVTRIVPVRPIERYEDRLDDRRMPIPVVPEQDLDPWEAELRTLLSDRSTYERLAGASRHAAARFAAGLGVEPYERFLAGLAPAAAAAPPNTETRQKLAWLSPEKLELLARRLKKKEAATASPAMGIPRLPRRATSAGDRFPLSFAQRRLWFLDRSDPGSLHYNEHFAVRLSGPLRVALLADALDRIVQRHEVLRTTYAYAEGAEEPLQVVHPAPQQDGPDGHLPLPVADLGALPEEARQSEAAHLATAESRRPFDLASGPVMRALLLGLGAGEHLLVITAHHIAVDNWSATVLFAELAALYEAAAAGTSPGLPELPVQYADYAAWQRGRLTATTLEGQIGFWRRKLAGAPALLDLPTDRPRPARQSFRGTRLVTVFPVRLAEALRTAARRRDATPYMLLLAACQTLLHRITGQSDLVVGTPVAGRTRREIEPLIGCFLNLLPMRTRLAPGLRFEELLDQARRTALDAFAHQDLPFGRLVEALAPERSLSHAPLFQVLFNFLNVPPRTEELHGGVRLDAIPVQTGTVRFDLELYLEEQARGLVIALDYNTDLFDGATMWRLLGHLETLLGGVAERPDEVLSALPLLTAAETHQLLHEWNDVAQDRWAVPPEHPGVHHLVAAQARRTPEAPAATFQGSTLTYAELAHRTSSLAAHLRSLGCGPETRVGVALERGLDMPVALLAVLESGAAYVPLDPGYPRERLAFVLEDAAPRVLITREHLLPALPPGGGTVLCLDRAAGGTDVGAPPPWDDRQLAYVLYTSGSTGRPKGVEVPHRALVNFLGSMRQTPGFAPGERLLAVTSLAFDIAALEIFLPLTAGGCVELASQEETTDGALLAARLRASGAGVLQATPATWRMLLDAGWAGDSALRALCGGEALPRDLATALAGRTRELWNLYGPTETTVWSAAARILPGESGPVSIGRPIAATRIHLLDRNARTVPLGVPGELWIGGAGLARGYLGRPDLTADRFRPDPLSAATGTPGGRLYRTGDLARHLPGGRMEMLGRIDDQIKLRGFRIELGEIEAALVRHPGIREAAVALRGGSLVAYVVPVDALPAVDMLRDFLRRSLPEPMIPGAFVSLAALPLTPNRKVDRKALPDPGSSGETGTFAAPRTPLEELLAGLWAEVLGRERVGIDDNFFALGGHSLLATRVFSRLRRLFGVELPLRTLFERPTVAELAATVEEARRGGAGIATPPLVPVPRTGDLPLSFAQERLWFLDQLDPGNPAYNIPAAFTLAGPLDAAALEASLGRIATRHEALRTTFARSGDRPIQVIAPLLRLALPRVDLGGLPQALRATEVLRLAHGEAARSFDLARGPLVRATLVRLEAGHHVALFNLHHIIADGWSLGVFVTELAAFYGALTADRPPSLPDLPVQYADYSTWQRVRLQAELLEDHLRWWRERLAGASHVLDLPTDRPRPAVQSRRGAQEIFALSPAISTALRDLSRREGATLFMTLAALFSALLSRQTGAEDLLFGSPIAGRDQAETEPLIGMFVNTLVLRAELAGEPAFREILGRMREMTLGAYAHQDLPFEKLVDSLQPERSLAHTPLFQVMLAFQNAPQGALELPGLKLTPLPAGRGTTQFDLLLSAVEDAGRLSGTLDYNRDLFDPATIARFLGHLRILAAGAVDHPEARLSALPLLSAPEIHQLQREWNDAAPASVETPSLSRLFEIWAVRAPEAVAVVCEGQTLSYGDLNTRANRLARSLRRLGVRAESRVGVCLERSLDLVVAVVAILKAGGAYVPLDTDAPDERLRYLLHDALGSVASPVLVTGSSLAGSFDAAGMDTLRIVRLDADESLARESPDNLPEAPAADHLAYVIYTSGSTGQPKGVQVTHHNVLRLFATTHSQFQIDERDVWTLFHSYAFDFSVWEIWGALLYGGRLVVVPYWVSRSPDAFHRLLCEEGVTVLNQTPSAFRQLVDADVRSSEEANLRLLRLVIFGGEALELASLAPWLARHGDRRPRLVNMYGITETTVHVTYRPVGALDLAASIGSSPIGRPIPDLRLHVLDRHLQPVPARVAGEICVGGAGLARGYLGRPDLTALRFIPDPWSSEPGQRLYRSGDLASRRPDGDVVYLGRIDHQVKIRGFRIELGEIEAALITHPGVREAVVVARGEGATGDRRLAAYVVPQAGATLDPAELRAFLAAWLPEHMVPPSWVVLDELPLTPSGKVDRKALPEPEAAASRDYVAPRSSLELAVAGIWAELLKVQRVGLTDNFFDLGGDSIKAVRLVSRINERLGADLRVQEVFRHQTVGSLVERLAIRSDRSLADELAAGRAEIERLQRAVLADERQRAKLPAGYEDFFPMSSIEKGMVYYTLLLPQQPIYHDQHAYVLSIPDLDRFYRALERMTERHPILRSAFYLDEFAEPMKVVRGMTVVRDVEDLSGLPAAEQQERIERYRAGDLHRKFTFRGEILWRLKLFRLAGDHCVAVWTWHHAILDGWSNLTFWLELNELLAREDLDQASVPPPAHTYKDYLAISLGRRRAPATEAFWRATLAGAGRNKLPFHRAATRELSAFGMRSLFRPLHREALLGLRERAAHMHVPLQALFLAAHLHLLRVTSGEQDVVTGVVSHDRPGIPDGDRIVGCFLNTFPIRLRLEPGESGASLARRVARFLVAEKEHEIPLVDIAGLVGARESAQNPIFDTLFNFMDFHLLEEVQDNVLFQPMAGPATGELPQLRSDEMTNTLFDLEVMATASQPFLRLKYLPRHFEEADIERALTLYDRILETLRRDAEVPLGAEALLSVEERGQLVAAYNDTLRGYPFERPLHGFFEEQAALHPDLPAVLCGDRSLTYGELERLANRLARHLVARGVRPGDNVGVCLERSPELVVALLGVLKAAAAYVPMEPSYPAARKEYIARQSAISFLLESLPEDLLESGATFPDTPVRVRPRPDDLAYTIYTSGSTGTPKGVMIAHHSAVNLIEWVNREFSVGPATRVLMLSSICFDLSVYDVFGALGAGASLVIARQPEIQDPAALKDLVTGRKITFWNSVPSTLGLLVQYLEETDPGFRGEDLRLAFLSGDWIPLTLPERARRFFPNLRVISLGGATEATVWSIFHPIGRIDEGWRSIPYGRPLDNNSFYVLNRHLELVPAGVVGDLHIGGVGLARGYAGDPEKTAAAYLPDPFGGPGGRLYRTGDLGRMLPEGEIELLGRNDHQVKVRGFRIELGEIESQLSRGPGVREAVVLARTDRAGQRYLCGYVVASGEVSIAALQEHLAASLPGYMIPDTFVVLSELPLSANGKIDRNALPEPKVANTAGGAGHTAPATAAESALVEIWEEVLGLSGLGTGHDFFALGGHSLSAIQVLTRVRRRFEVDLPLPDFFENPTIAGLAGVIERLHGTGAAVPPHERFERPARLPLSFAQERLWFLDRLQPDNAAYNIPLALGLRGTLSVAVLAASLSAMVARHEALRTTFAEVAGHPVQRISPPFDLRPPVADLEALPEEERQDEARRLLGREAARPFDLERGPLVRAALIRLAGNHHLALLNVHHIVADGWSMGVLVAEVGSLYASLVRGERPALPPLSIQYADFAVWQRETWTAEALAGELTFWRERLADAPEVLDLPFDRRRPAVQRFRGAQLPSLLPSSRLAGLAEAQRHSGTTLFMVLLAAFQALLARLTAREDIVIGSPVAGRHRVETESLIGFFVNTLALRGDLSGDPTFAELLARVRATAVEAYTHDALPFERLVQELQPERSLSYAPVFQVIFALQNAPLEALELPGLTLEPAGFEIAGAKLDLSVSLTEGRQGIAGVWEYDRDLFDPATIRRFQDRFGILLSGALADPSRRLSELPLLSASESHQVIREWNDTRPEETGEVPVPQRLAEQAARTPEAPALEMRGRTVRAGELDRGADRIARRLLELGAGPGTVVGLCAGRSPELVAGLLGVWKAGAAYLPLDPAYPDARLSFLLEDARSAMGREPLLFTEEPLAARLAALAPAGTRLVRLEEVAAGEQDAPLTPRARPGDPAYLIYTSGTTGLPKAVVVEHRNLASVLDAARRTFAFSAGDRMPCLAPFSFDISLFELLGMLLAGGTSVLYELRPTLDVRALAAGLGGMTRLHAVPALLRQIVEAAREGGPYPGMRTVFVGGDAVPSDLLAGLPALFPRAEIQVLYGPTEATIICSHERVSGRDDAGTSRLPLGRPLECARLSLIDRHGRPVPIGVAGEVAIGGAGVTRGYLNRPELTAERFPLLDGRRVYRSGDLARHLPDGRLEFLGRIDGQVKIRGFRIEPGEIEAALARHPAVREAVVAVREVGDRQLVAYVVPRAGEDATRPSFPAELRTFLAERLPEHLVPAFLVPLAELPLSPHGKVDRQALPAPGRTATATPAAAPRTAFEEMLAEIWRDVLSLPAGSFGVHDNFFALGGHSLLATQVVSRVRQLTGVEIPVRALFERPTLAGLAPRLEQALQGEDAGAEPLVPEPRPGFPPLSFTQERLWFLSRLAPEDSAYNMPFQVRFRGALDAGALGRSLAEVVRRHESLRTTFRLLEGRAVQVIAPPAADGLSLPLADLAALPEEARAAEGRRLAAREATRPFVLESGPLLRALLVRLAPEEHVALLNTHHAVSDAWSTGLLFREIAALYPAFREGSPSPLPELPIQYADFAIWQRRRLSGGTQAAQAAWWREHLGGGLTPLDLPADRPRPTVQDSRGGSTAQILAPELTRAITELGRREGATLFMVLLAAFQVLLGRWSGQEDVVVGTPVAGRDRRETEGLIGLFLNTLALRTHLGGNPSFRTLLGRVRETALGAYAHAELPFEKLVEELRPQRDLSRSPLFDVMLNVVNTPPARAEIPGLELAFEEPANPGAKFSLTLYATEREGRLHLHLVYQAALFTPERAAGILDQLAILLEQAVAEPERPVLSYSLVTAAARALLPDPAAPLPAPRYETVPELVQEQATRAPGAPAVRQGDRAWSYGELAERSLALARMLAATAERRGETVAVSGAPSFGLVAALVAVLRSGCVMLTLDPALPPARRRVMAREAGARRVVLVDALASGEDLQPEVESVLHVHPGSGRLLGGGGGEQGSPVEGPLPAPEDPAYVFFTSGSTGVPKAILGCHRGVSHFLAWQRETFRIGPGDRCAQLTALSFDALLRDVFLPLTSGATLCLPDAAGLPPAQIVPWLEREGITLVHTLPAVAQTWIGCLRGPVPLPALRWIFLSGEPLTGTLVRRLRQAFPGEAAILNLYGPTETTMTKCFYAVPDEPVPGIQPLGHPLPETQALVLGPESRLCGIGEAGEIVLRTPFRTLGYLNAPEEGRARFVPNPFRDDPDDLLYRTGDRGRYRPDGSLEILGRLDDQVKVRGVRVEPGEVEAALLRHPSVAAAVVVARPDAAGAPHLVAYAARARGRNPSAGELREHLRQELPDPLLPSAFVILDALPLGPTGKVDRRALPEPEGPETSRSGSAAPRTALEDTVAGIWKEVLQRDTVGLYDNFFDLGGHSLRLVEVHSRLASLVGGELPLVELFHHPTVSSLALYLEGLAQGGTAPASPEERRPREAGEAESRALAIVGMGGRFPGAPDLERFWRNLCDGVESVTFFSDEELLASGIDPATVAAPRYVKAGSVLDGIDRFDAAFFGFTPREAEILDPQHRLFLELSWEVLERAGYDPQRYPDPIGVYAGVHRSTYLLNLYSHPELVRAVGDGILKQTTDKDYLTTRVSYKLGLRGPSFAVQTTCSTSLVAVHLACQAILAGECRMALAGGVSVRVPQEQGYFREEGDILSPDGHCRPFDAESRGTVFTNGLGLVLLKRLDDALDDGDTIHAVIRGTAINNDGAGKVGYTAPGLDGQAEVIGAAQRAAGVDPGTITYLEAHGTATLLGDPIEIAALTRAFRDGGATRSGFCAIGSVKSNVGHLDTAAGVAGLIKTALALEHGLIPPSLHFERPNPNIDFASSPFYVNTALTEWRAGGEPRRAGVSSFGIGGTNAHAILEEPPPRKPAGPARPWQLLLLSARTPAALDAAASGLARHLESHPGIELADAAFTLQTGRRIFEHRRAVVCRDREDAVAALRAAERWTSGAGDPGGRPVAFLFPGQGTQHAGMGRELYEAEPTFREVVDSCAGLLAPLLGLDLRCLLFPSPEEAGTAGRTLAETRFAQPALFVVEYALARLWMEWGIRPTAMIGHSLGEYVAACLAGVFSLPDALTLVAARGRLMQELPPGGMLAVSLPEEPLRSLLAEAAPEVSLAAVNAPVLCSVSGPLDALDALAAHLAERGVEHRRLQTSHAFHSALMEPALRPFAELVGGIELRPPRLRYLSNVTGTWIRAAEATDPGYWARHLREPVRFSAGLSTLLAEPRVALLEVGPGRTLAGLVRRHESAGNPAVPAIASMRDPRDEGEAGLAFLLRALGRLWLAGAEPDWNSFHAHGRRRRVPLPTYPFERKRHWVERRREETPAAATWAGPLAAAGWQIVMPSGRPLDPDGPEDMAALLAVLRQAAGPGTAGELTGREDAAAGAAPVAGGPEDPAERRLAAIWEELLGVPGIGAHDDFFELGGHSLMATRLVSRIRETFRAELPIEAVFAAPTPARLAARIEIARLSAEAPPSIARVPRTQRMPLSFAQQRLLFLEVLTPGDISYNMPLALRLHGAVDAGALRGALEGLVRRHETLRTTYVLSKGEAWQAVAPPPAPGTHPVPAIDLRALPAGAAGEESRRLAAAEIRRPLDIFRGPVFRSTLLRLGAEDHVLLMTVHHIATDGWSWGILYGELVELYEALCEKRPPRLPELPVQYADYAAWLRDWLSGAEMERQIGYWRETLAGLPLTEVPPDHPRPRVRTGRGSLASFSFPHESTEALRRLGRSEDATLFMVLLSSFCSLVHHYGKEDDLVVGTDVANRRWKEAEGIIGLFVNQLVIRAGLAGDPTFRDLLRRIRRTTLDAYAHQDAPFDKLVEVLNPVRDMSRTPLFQVKLVLQNASVETRVARGLAVSLLDFHNRTAKFDLLLNLSESGTGLRGNLEYCTDLYAPETAAALLGQFTAVLGTVAERPDIRLSEIGAALAERDRDVRARRLQERRETRGLTVERVRRKAIAVAPGEPGR